MLLLFKEEEKKERVRETFIVGQAVSPDGWTCLKLDLVSIPHKLMHFLWIDLHTASQEATYTNCQKLHTHTKGTAVALYFYTFGNYEHGEIIGTRWC